MKSFIAKSELYGGWHIKSMFWVLKNAVVWANVWELALSWWRVIYLRRLVFLISWKTTGKQVVVYHSDCGISKTRILNAATAFSGVEKRTYGNKKKSFDAKPEL